MDTPTSDDVSDDVLSEMETRVGAASAGPWFSLVVGRDSEAGLNCIELGCCAAMEVLGGTVADQDFIAHAREDLPRLIDEVRRLRAKLTQVSYVTQSPSQARRTNERMSERAAEFDAVDNGSNLALN